LVSIAYEPGLCQVSLSNSTFPWNQTPTVDPSFSLRPAPLFSPLTKNPQLPFLSSSSGNIKSRVKSISSRSILSSQTLNRSLGSKTRGLARRALCNTADVDKLVADGVGDNVGVQGVLLSLGDGGVDWEEGSLGGFAAGSAKREGHGWVAGAEFSGYTRDGACYCSRCGEECEEEGLGLHFEVEVNVTG
jgi:hypothetical protein